MSWNLLVRQINRLEKRVAQLEKNKQEMIVALANDKTITVPICICGQLNCKKWHNEEEIKKYGFKT